MAERNDKTELGSGRVEAFSDAVFEPPRLLVHTHWSDLSATPDTPEHYQEVTWALTERDGATELTVSEQNLPSHEAKAVSEQSWGTVLGNLKSLLEP